MITPLKGLFSIILKSPPLSQLKIPTDRRQTSWLFKTLNFLPLTYWHEYLDMVFFFKLIHKLVNIAIAESVIPKPRTSRPTRYSNSDYDSQI